MHKRCWSILKPYKYKNNLCCLRSVLFHYPTNQCWTGNGFVIVGSEKGKEDKIPIRWEDKRELVNFSHCWGSEKREKNISPTCWEVKRDK